MHLFSVNSLVFNVISSLKSHFSHELHTMYFSNPKVFCKIIISKIRCNDHVTCACFSVNSLVFNVISSLKSHFSHELHTMYF